VIQMLGWAKPIQENKDEIRIAYSVESDRSCDGVLVWDKKTEEFRVDKMSATADAISTRRLAGLIGYHLDEGSFTPGLNCLMS